MGETHHFGLGCKVEGIGKEYGSYNVHGGCFGATVGIHFSSLQEEPARKTGQFAQKLHSQCHKPKPKH